MKSTAPVSLWRLMLTLWFLLVIADNLCLLTSSSLALFNPSSWCPYFFVLSLILTPSVFLILESSSFLRAINTIPNITDSALQPLVRPATLQLLYLTVRILALAMESPVLLLQTWKTTKHSGKYFHFFWLHELLWKSYPDHLQSPADPSVSSFSPNL